MKNLLTFLVFISLSIFTVSCGSGDGNSGGATSAASKPGISGTIANASNMQIFFDKTSLNNANQVLGKTDIDATGNFHIPIEGNLDPGIYRLRIGAKNIAFPLNGTEKGVEITTDLNTITKFDAQIKGSPDANEYVSIMSEFVANKDIKAATEKIKNSSNIVGATVLASTLLRSDQSHVAVHDNLAKKLDAQFPTATYTKEYKAFAGQLAGQIAQRAAREKIKVGQPAPDIKLPSPTGKEYALSDLKGKIVLIDFWASWCGPCRRANPHVVETYKKYKDQGFTVYSVSLDGMDSRTKSRFKNPEQVEQQMKNQKKRWTDAIAKDNLIWNYHVSDLKKWESGAAKEYGVSSIPKTFLIDRDGKIAAVNPRNDLEAQLKKLL